MHTAFAALASAPMAGAFLALGLIAGCVLATALA
ncbi:hypothetical protein GA0115259_102552 [Streptomyces sp. MnatMP-M17]|nr:hypothetical protein GA0115259_102552 [Streptomyces sp. MnatMP-M17]